MKIICEKTALITGVNIALRAIPTKTTMEILDCLKINLLMLLYMILKICLE